VGNLQRSKVVSIVGVVIGVAFAACMSATDRPPIDDVGSTPTGSTGSTGSTTTDAGSLSCFGAEDAGCNDLALCGPKCLVTNVAQAAPAPLGGAITPGVYTMTNYYLYNGPGGATGQPGNWFKETFQVLAPPDAGVEAGVSVDAAVEAGNEDAGPVLISYPWFDVTASDQAGADYLAGFMETQGTSLTLVFTCPGASPFPATYSATSTTVTLYYDVFGNTPGGLVYTLQ
jgi:hypothetical protein